MLPNQNILISNLYLYIIVLAKTFSKIGNANNSSEIVQVKKHWRRNLIKCRRRMSSIKL